MFVASVVDESVSDTFFQLPVLLCIVVIMSEISNILNHGGKSITVCFRFKMKV